MSQQPFGCICDCSCVRAMHVLICKCYARTQVHSCNMELHHWKSTAVSRTVLAPPYSPRCICTCIASAVANPFVERNASREIPWHGVFLHTKSPGFHARTYLLSHLIMLTSCELRSHIHVGRKCNGSDVQARGLLHVAHAVTDSSSTERHVGLSSNSPSSRGERSPQQREYSQQRQQRQQQRQRELLPPMPKV